MINAKIVSYDTSMTRLRVILETEDNQQLECWVMDEISNKLFNEKYTTEIHEYHIAESDNHRWITQVI